MIGSLRMFAITWIGTTRTGKSLCSKTIMMAQSKYEIDEDKLGDEMVPSMITAKFLDFFKAEPITKYKPGGFDDGVMHKQDSAFLKAFLNPSEEDATVWARYTSAQFDQGASRQACNNAYDRELEKKLYDEMQGSRSYQIDYTKFVLLIRPSFASVDEGEDMDAILTRTHMILITPHGVYYRVATTSQDPVSFIAWPAGEPHDLLAPQYKPVFMEYKKDPTHHKLPASHHEDMVWSQALLTRLIMGEPVPPTLTIMNPNFFTRGPSPSLQLAPDLLNADEMVVKVKQEKKNSISTPS